MVLSASLVVKLNDFVYFRNRKLTIYITYPNHKLIAQRTSRKISPHLSLFYYIQLQKFNNFYKNYKNSTHVGSSSMMEMELHVKPINDF